MSTAPGVARLFVGLPVPPEVGRKLMQLGPRPQQGVRVIAATEMHITLHFLGSMDTGPVRECLRAVTTPAFSLRLDHPGSFAPRGRRRILWVGVVPSPGLLALHALTAGALRGVGFEPEQRPYKPHITLARLKPVAARQLVEDFERRPFRDAGLEFECRRFALFESETAPEGARYSVIESYPLTGAG